MMPFKPGGPVDAIQEVTSKVKTVRVVVQRSDGLEETYDFGDLMQVTQVPVPDGWTDQGESDLRSALQELRVQLMELVTLSEMAPESIRVSPDLVARRARTSLGTVDDIEAMLIQ